MNPTFSSPVLQERVTYTWEDLQKAAAGVFTDTLKNEKARLESLAQKGIPLQDMPPAEPAAPVTPTDQPRTPVFEEPEVARPAASPRCRPLVRCPLPLRPGHRPLLRLRPPACMRVSVWPKMRRPWSPPRARRSLKHRQPQCRGHHPQRPLTST